MFNLGMGEIAVILLLALIFLGPKKLPDLASGLGKIIRDIRKATSDVKNEIALDDTFRKPFEELRDAVTLHPEELKRRDEIRRSLEEARLRAEAAEVPAAPEADQKTPPPIGSAVDEALAAVDATIADVAPEPPPGSPAYSNVLPPHITAHAPPPAPPPVAAPAQESPPPAPAPRPAAIGVASPASPPSAPAPRAFPPGPPPGTVSAPPTRFGAPRVNPPTSSLNSDKANTTQVLSEEDLLPTLKPPAVPVRKSTPPPLPGIVKQPPPPPGSKKA